MLNRGADSASRFFNLPADQVFEVGTRVEIDTLGGQVRAKMVRSTRVPRESSVTIHSARSSDLGARRMLTGSFAGAWRPDRRRSKGGRAPALWSGQCPSHPSAVLQRRRPTQRRAMRSSTVTVTCVDHLVLKCADIETTLGWYIDRLGLAPVGVEE